MDSDGEINQNCMAVFEKAGSAKQIKKDYKTRATSPEWKTKVEASFKAANKDVKSSGAASKGSGTQPSDGAAPETPASKSRKLSRAGSLSELQVPVSLLSPQSSPTGAAAARAAAATAAPGSGSGDAWQEQEVAQVQLPGLGLNERAVPGQSEPPFVAEAQVASDGE